MKLKKNLVLIQSRNKIVRPAIINPNHINNMKKMYGYIRVSTAKQGEGVSLTEQKYSIENYAVKHNLEIVEWFEEKETAAKKGRPIFSSMLKLLKARKADGMIIHKIDRSARNLRDWADLGELIDSGVEVHFAHEAIDLAGRGGRLSADIQAVIAADYIRNLREETKKGLYGRLKQGIYPFRAPVGYQDTGAGNPKAIDPIMGPLVKKTFELYSTGRYGFRELLDKMHKAGLRNRNGRKIVRNGLSTILHNQFYIGVINIKASGQVFEGKHKPLISKSLFDKVQLIAKQKTIKSVRKHNFQFRKSITCALCGYSMIGEKQKGIIYYRCQTKGCPTKCIREDRIESCISDLFRSIRLKPEELTEILDRITDMTQRFREKRNKEVKEFELHCDQLQTRISRLTDKFIDDLIDKETFNSKKEKLLSELAECKEKLSLISGDPEDNSQRLIKFLEQLQSLYFSYNNGILEEKRDILSRVTSNLYISGKTLEISLNSPYAELHERKFSSQSGPQRDMTRTFDGCNYQTRQNLQPQNDTISLSSTAFYDIEHLNSNGNGKPSISNRPENRKSRSDMLTLIEQIILYLMQSP